MCLRKLECEARWMTLLTVLFLPHAGQTQSEHVFTLSNVRARPLAMGGAYTSVEDDLASPLFNPAAYFVRNREQSWGAIFVSPVSPVVAIARRNELFSGEGNLVDDVLMATSLLLKSASLRLTPLRVGVLLGEEGLGRGQMFSTQEITNVEGYRQNHFHMLTVRLQLAEKVSVGASGSWYVSSRPDDPQKRQTGVAMSYGILLKPEERLNVGVSFFNIPDSLPQVRLPLERIIDESVNIGASYRFPTQTLLSVDLRNLGEEQAEALRELHFGIEQTLWSHLAIRGGFFNQKGGTNVYSFGVSLLNGTKLWRKDPAIEYENFYLNYAFVLEKGPERDTRWHFFHLLIRI